MTSSEKETFAFWQPHKAEHTDSAFRCGYSVRVIREQRFLRKPLTFYRIRVRDGFVVIPQRAYNAMTDAEFTDFMSAMRVNETESSLQNDP